MAGDNPTDSTTEEKRTDLTRKENPGGLTRLEKVLIVSILAALITLLIVQPDVTHPTPPGP